MNDYFIAVIFMVKDDNVKRIIDVKNTEAEAMSFCTSINVMKFDYKLDYIVINLSYLLVNFFGLEVK